MPLENLWARSRWYGPQAIRYIAAEYYRRRDEREVLRTRISRTELGAAWLAKLDRIGKKDGNTN